MKNEVKQAVDISLAPLHPRETLYSKEEIEEAREKCIKLVLSVEPERSAELNSLSNNKLYEILLKWSDYSGEDGYDD